MKQWEIDGLKQQAKYLEKLAAKPTMTSREWHMYRGLTGDVDYTEADAGMEREIRS